MKVNRMASFEKRRWFTAKEICDFFNVNTNVFLCFRSEIPLCTDEIRHEKRGRHKKMKVTLYTNHVLKLFRVWLVRRFWNVG